MANHADVSASQRGQFIVLAVDPGREKCGVVVLLGTAMEDCGSDATTKRLFQAVVSTIDLGETVRELLTRHDVSVVVVGDATGGKSVVSEIRALASENVSVEVVSEQNTTQQARRRYWQENPPQSLLRRLLPRSMQLPPRPWDDYAALLLAENRLKKS